MDRKRALTRVIQAGARGSLLLLLAVTGLFAAGCCKLVPWALAVDPSLSATENGDAVLEPGEAALVEPTWKKVLVPGSIKQPESEPNVIGPKPCALRPGTTGAGSFTAFEGPTGPRYKIIDDAANYGAWPSTGANITKSCVSTGNCYSIFVSSPETRPAQHWDASLTEQLAGGYGTTWKIHVGGSFSDVSRSNPFYAKIETLLHNGITTGCAPNLYCPGEPISRSTMALFLARAIARGDANVPFTGTANGVAYSCTAGGTSLFSDVKPTDSFCRHVHYIAAQNVTLGCSPTQFCPDEPVSRLQMAALVAKAILAPQGGAGVPETLGSTYSCDPASPNVHFTDVSAGSPFCKHVHYIWSQGIVNGCGPNEYCPDGDVARDQMAKFVANAFGLRLYGP